MPKPKPKPKPRYGYVVPDSEDEEAGYYESPQDDECDETLDEAGIVGLWRTRRPGVMELWRTRKLSIMGLWRTRRRMRVKLVGLSQRDCTSARVYTSLCVVLLSMS